MIEALKYLSECSLTYLLNDLKPKSNLIVLTNAIVPVSIIITIIHYPLCIGCMNFILV